MTNDTSFSSAPGTTEEPEQDRTGKRPTERNSADTLAKFLKEHPAQGNNLKAMSDLDYWWWNAKTIVRHLWGSHTLVASETWSFENGSVFVQHNGWRCWRCDYRED